jgi:hypothetical protein
MTHVVSPLAVYPPLNALRQSDWIDRYKITANTARTVTAPAGAKYVHFSANGDFAMRMTANGVTVVPATYAATDVTDGAAAELNPGPRELFTIAGDSMSLIAPVDTIITLMFTTG